LKIIVLGSSLLLLISFSLSYGVVSPVSDFNFGSSGSGNGQLNAPEDAAIDSAGNIYVVDTGNNRIQKFNSAGVYVSKFGSFGTSNGQFRSPSGIAIDSAGNIYVADTNNNRIQKFNSAGTYVSKFGFSGTTNGGFSQPDDLAIDSAGNIYVADTNNNRIQKFNSAGTYVSKFGTLGTGNGQFNAPSAIALDASGNIYVADTNNHRIQKFNSAGTYVSKFGTLGTSNGQFNVPQGISLDNYTNILISDTGNHRIQKFTNSGTFVVSFGSFGTGAGQFNYPQQITMNGLQGFVADTTNRRIWVFHFPNSPVADDQRVVTVEETPISITLTASDVNNDALTYSVVAPPANGVLTGTAPLLLYTPNVNSFGTDSFTFKANDGANDSNVATVEIDVDNINDSPTSSSQSVTTNEDTQLAISVIASDPDADTLQYVMVDTVQHGSISGTLPNVTYAPNLNYFGSDSFSFKVNDGLADSNTSTISITVNSINDPPMAYDVNATLNEDTPIHTSSIPYQQTDVENDPVSFIVITPLSHGTLSGDPLDLIYTPDSNYYGTDCLTFKFNDGEFDSNVATACAIILSVNDPPVTSNQSVQTDEDVPLNITLNATDVENDSLTYQVVTSPSHGVLSGSAPNLTYTPDQNYFGTDDFLFRAYDGADYGASNTVSITVNPVNDPPVAYSMNFTTPEDTPFGTDAIVASDIEGDALTYILVAPPSHGALSGAVPDLIYTPAADYVGSDSIRFKVNDGEFDSNVVTVYMEVGPVEDQPTAYAQSVITDEDVPIDITLTASDVDNDVLTYSIVTPPSQGSISGVLPNVTYTPAQNDYGTESFSFKANDGLTDGNTATISITINPVNDPPVFADIYQTMYEDTPFPFQSLDIDGSDVEDDPLTHITVSSFSHITFSGPYPNFSLVPALNYFGSDEYAFKLNDGEFDSNIIHAYIAILPVNDAPVSDDQQITMEPNTLQHIELTASDIENDTLTFAVISQPSHGILFENAPHISYLPNLNYVGTDEFTFKANDGNTTSLPSTVSITVESTAQEIGVTAGDSGQFTIDAIPRISKFGISADKSGDSGFYDLSGSAPTRMLKAATGEKVILQITLDDEEASKNITHLGLYMNVQKTNSDITNSNAYVIFDTGLPLKVVDADKIFRDVQLDTSYLGKSMIVDVILTFDKPMVESDIILEVWNKGRHPVYETIPSILEVVESEDDSGPNISGSAFLPEKVPRDPIQISSTSGGKATEIKDNTVLVVKNKDLGITLSGFIKDGERGEKVDVMILRPDDSVYKISAFLNEHKSYMVPTKLHSKWSSGFYEILVSYMGKEEGKIQFYVTDKESSGGGYSAILEQPGIISAVFQYLSGNMTKVDFTSNLKEVGWSPSRIDDFITSNRQAYVNPYTFYYLAGLIPLLYILVSFLGKKKPKTADV
jgi:DNA-binding beta-propeller fold protein YncE